MSIKKYEAYKFMEISRGDYNIVYAVYKLPKAPDKKYLKTYRNLD